MMLPDWPDDDDEQAAITPTECAVWSLIFFGLATLIMINRPATADGAGRYIIIAGIGYIASLIFLFLAMFGNRR